MNDNESLGAFEPLDGAKPYTMLDRHPNGQFIALQAYSAAAHGPRAAVWDAMSGKLAWKPDGTSALCWSSDGRHALLLRETYQRDPQHPPIIASPLQSEFTYWLERQSWPEHTSLSTCGVKPPEGWVDRVVLSPRGEVAAVRWLEQDAAGFVLIGLGPDGDCQWPNAGYRTAPDNLVQGPVFSPDGRFLVLTCGCSFWWSVDGEDPLQPATGGRYEVGHIAIYDLAERGAREILVEDEVREGWLPDDPEDMRYELLGAPLFDSDREFTVMLPTGIERRFGIK